ncbi:hypothetical protein [Brevibacillus choshinensis]|uniref:Uncharacterized protein n=1 Tax=Brevibacillus choshinensis TaxID=54911 RepID=A0ABX7FUY9_BRECH|nr:hypothetical protein [Brevibacillus choshinensis]QRG69560.1 hypothetical protein JNE38_10775 [Brevibacillus choshinensis]
MKRLLLSSILAFVFLGIADSSAAQSGQVSEQPSVIYQISADGTAKKAVAQMPYMHRGAISPSGRYVYTERIGYGKNDPTVPYVYNLQTKKLTQLSGFAKWSSSQDILYVLEKGGVVRINPADGKKTVLVEAVPQYPVLEFAVSPDEQYMAFFRRDEKSADKSQATHLYLQHLPSGKMKINDRIAWEKPAYRGPDAFYWLPTSKKVFYRTQDAYKELDLPTGLKYTHKLNAFPSYSTDMKYKYVRAGNEEYLLDLQTGKKVTLQKQAQVIMENYLDRIVWSPTGHQFVSEQVLAASGNAHDVYMMIRLNKDERRHIFPFGDVGESKYSPYMSFRENLRLIGWSKDGKSFYAADWSSIHYSVFSPEKLDEYLRVMEK